MLRIMHDKSRQTKAKPATKVAELNCMSACDLTANACDLHAMVRFRGLMIQVETVKGFD